MIVYARLLARGCKTNNTFKAKPSTPPGISIVFLGIAPQKIKGWPLQHEKNNRNRVVMETGIK